MRRDYGFMVFARQPCLGSGGAEAPEGPSAWSQSHEAFHPSASPRVTPGGKWAWLQRVGPSRPCCHVRQGQACEKRGDEIQSLIMRNYRSDVIPGAKIRRRSVLAEGGGSAPSHTNGLFQILTSLSHAGSDAAAEPPFQIWICHGCVER